MELVLPQKERQDMRGKGYSPEQIIGILREAEGAKTAREVIRRYGISEMTFYRWKRAYAGMEVTEVRKLKGIQEENMRLKKLVADQALKIQLLEEVNSKKW
jgi:putative transposase